ncbi:MAG TPA: glycosyltransferase family 9 protein [Acetobacteraceae bacterium]|nr:glycosyltransferase family 9 protein [Acetobacteraceae bacterium]
MRILFVSGNRVGDAVLTCGVLDHLIRRHPHCRVTVVCGAAAEGVFARMPNRERTILIDKQRFDRHWLELWLQVVGTRWDLVVDLKGSGLAYLLRARRRALRTKRHPIRMYEQHAAVLGISPAPLPIVWTAPEDRAKAASLIPEGRPAIAFGPTANWAPKTWAPDRFAALLQCLRAGPLPGAAALVLGGPGPHERALADPVLAAIPGAIDLCGKLTIAETAACIQRARLYVGNDSGLMHLAAACGTPTIGLCGTTADRAVEMAPIGRRAAWALAPEPTMEALSVESAFEACVRLLELDADAPDSGELVYSRTT